MNVLRIAINDVRVVLKDRMVLFWWMALPLAFVFLFSFMFGDRSQQGTWIPVFRHDAHELSALFVQELRGERFATQVQPASKEHLIDDWPRALVIPADFSTDVLSGKRVDLILTQGRGSPEKFLAAQTLLVRTLIKFNGAVAAVDLVERGWSDETQAALLAALAQPDNLTVTVQDHFSLRPPPSGIAYTLPAYMVMFVMMMTLMYGGIVLIQERNERRMSRLAAAPVSPTEIFLGKMLARVLQPVLQGGLLIVAGVLLFDVQLGDHPWALVPVMLSFAFFCGAIGLLYGVLFRNEQQVNGIGILTTMVLSALGGCWWPIEIVPDTFKTVAQCTPTYWAIRGLQDVMSFGKSWIDIIPECSILMAFGLALMAIAIPLFRWD